MTAAARSTGVLAIKVMAIKGKEKAFNQALRQLYFLRRKSQTKQTEIALTSIRTILLGFFKFYFYFSNHKQFRKNFWQNSNLPAILKPTGNSQSSAKASHDKGRPRE